MNSDFTSWGSMGSTIDEFIEPFQASPQALIPQYDDSLLLPYSTGYEGKPTSWSDSLISWSGPDMNSGLSPCFYSEMNSGDSVTNLVRISCQQTETQVGDRGIPTCQSVDTKLSGPVKDYQDAVSGSWKDALEDKEVVEVDTEENSTVYKKVEGCSKLLHRQKRRNMKEKVGLGYGCLSVVINKPDEEQLYCSYMGSIPAAKVKSLHVKAPLKCADSTVAHGRAVHVLQYSQHVPCKFCTDCLSALSSPTFTGRT